MQKVSSKMSAINIEVGLDNKNIPEQINWEATDAEPGKHESSAMLLALWNAKEKTSMRIDLWTKDMTIPEMNIFIFQTLLGVSETFERATHNKTAANDLRLFAKTFFEKIQNNG
jgi:gliding motility-associated protein GldC